MLLKVLSYPVEKCPECRLEKIKGKWIKQETKTTTSKYCPTCAENKKLDFSAFMLEQEYPTLKFDASPEDFKRARELGLTIDFAMGYIFYVFPDGSAVKV